MKDAIELRKQFMDRQAEQEQTSSERNILVKFYQRNGRDALVGIPGLALCLALGYDSSEENEQWLRGIESSRETG